MNKIEIFPLVGMGKIKLGMDKETVRNIIDGPVKNIPAHTNSGIDFPDTDHFHASELSVTYSHDTDTVNWIGLSKGVAVNAVYQGINVFTTSADAVVAHTKQFGKLDNEGDEPGYSFCFPELGICYWRETNPDKLRIELDEADDDEERKFIAEEIIEYEHFQQVSVFVVGYWD